MADTVKTASTLNIECVFSDADTRTITLKNPRSDISSDLIQNLNEFMQTNNIIVGDKASSDFRKIKRAIRRDTATTYLDLE